MQRKFQFSAALVGCTISGLLAAAMLVYIPQYVTSAVNDSSRPDSDRERDAIRKPALVIAFAGIRPGQKMVELMPGGGYFTRIFCQILGPKGHLYPIAMMPAVKRNAPAEAGAERPRSPCHNVTADIQNAADLHLPAGLDVVWTSENYHDLHNAMFGKPDMKAFDRAIFDALKPGGVFIVEDHAAAEGSGARDTETLHRIDPELVKQEVTSAGFVFDGASDALRNPDDTHDVRVFDLKGRSDKFLFKFRKPKGGVIADNAGAAPPAHPKPTGASQTPAAAAPQMAPAEPRRLTGQKIVATPGGEQFVLQLTSPEGEVQFALSREDLKELATQAGALSEGQ
ncbi:MAG TPA: hypothetical protein VIX87_08060 [Steroidobacteraceae bacterium]